MTPARVLPPFLVPLLALLLARIAVGAPSPASPLPQGVAGEWTFESRSGALAKGVPEALIGSGPGARIKLRATGDGMNEIDLAGVVQAFAEGAAGAPPAVDAEVRLVGGQVVRGRLVGGDDAGDTLRVLSPSLGEMTLRVERLQLILLLDRLGRLDPDRFLAAREAAQDEILFQRSAAGVDQVNGVVSRFNETGVVFEWEKADKPTPFAYEKLVAIAFKNGKPPARAAPLRWLLADGSILDGSPKALADGRLTLATDDDKEARIELRDLRALESREGSHTFVSSLKPREVKETSFFGDGEAAQFPHRMDRSVSGSTLRVAGRAFLRGIGCHSRTVLRYDVPAGAVAFRSWVGIDDETATLPVRGHVVFRVLVDDAPGADPIKIRGGELPARVDVPLKKGTRVLTLEVDFGEDFHLADRADWLGAVIVRG